MLSKMGIMGNIIMVLPGASELWKIGQVSIPEGLQKGFRVMLERIGETRSARCVLGLSPAVSSTFTPTILHRQYHLL